MLLAAAHQHEGRQRLAPRRSGLAGAVGLDGLQGDESRARPRRALPGAPLSSRFLGELLAIMDAQHLTTLRTGATSAVATRRLARSGPAAGGAARVGGGGARAARGDAGVGLSSKSARVYSPTTANRERLAEEFRGAARHRHQASRRAPGSRAGREIVLAAVKSTQTVVFGELADAGHARELGRHGQARSTRDRSGHILDAAARSSSTRARGYSARQATRSRRKDVVRPDQVYELAELVVGQGAGRGLRRSDHACSNRSGPACRTSRSRP